MALQDWVRKGRELGASDLHVEADTAVVARVRGDLTLVGSLVPAASRSRSGC